MRNIILFLIGQTTSIVFSQSTENVELQNFAPKSPEASSFQKYGDYPVDLSTGLTNISIPIYTVQVGSFSLPITLNYHPSGIKVSDEATWVGLGWNLNAGAQIILDVRDAPDEYTGNYNTIPNANDVSTYISNHPLGYYDSYFQYLKSDSWVRDVYNFSSPTANGKFVIDNFSTEEITVYPPDAFRVEILHVVGEKGFKITDKYGNIYTFSNTREYSQTLQQYQPALYTSGWFVDKIETPKHDVIGFSYIDGGDIVQNSYGESITHKKLLIPDFECVEGAEAHSETISPIISNLNRLRTITKKISKIEFNEGRILFNSSSGRLDFYNVNNINTLTDGPKKLDFIEIQQKNYLPNSFATIKKYQFYYSYFDSGNPNGIYTKTHRLKLDKISNIQAIDTPEETFFTYSDVQLPTKDSKSVDFYGYFNGKSNLSMIPHQSIIYTPASFATPTYESIGNADRRVDVLKIEAGILKEIKYPTKGITKFEYEPNTYFGIDKFDKFNEHKVSGYVVQGTGLGTSPPSETPGVDDIPQCTAPNPIDCVQYLQIPFDAIHAKGVISFQVNVAGDQAHLKYQYARVRVYDSSGEVYNLKINYTGFITANINLNGTGYILIEAYGAFMSVQDTQLKYYNNDLNPKNNFGAGLRIKSITNVNHDSEIVTKKVYEYTKSQNPNLSSGVLINDIYTTFQSNSITNYSVMCCNKTQVGGGQNNACFWIESISETYNSNSINGIENNSVTYSEVTEKSVDITNIINGYSIYKFSTDADMIIDNRGIIKIETGYKRGRLLSKEVYKGNAIGSPFLINKLINEYTEDTRKISVVKGFKMFQFHYLNSPLLNNTLPLPLNNFFESVGYNVPVKWFYQKSSESVDYFYNSSNIQTGSVINKTNYIYDNPNHLQLTRTETTNGNNEVLKTTNYYADDLISVPFMSALKSQNRIGEIIRTETFRDATPLSVKNSIYKDWGNNLFMPELIQGSKGSGNLENRMRFNVIDNTNGNPIELQMEDGTPVVYIWGYNKTQPIAKIENATYNQVQGQVSQLQSLSDTGTEAQLIQELNVLRSILPDAMLTTYTYIPLVGVSTITDAKGYTIYYKYDEMNRLSAVKDAEGNIVSQNEYHYKN